MDYIETASLPVARQQDECLYLTYHHNSDFVIEKSFVQLARAGTSAAQTDISGMHARVADLNMRIEPVSTYPHSVYVPLPDRAAAGGKTLEHAIWGRRSLRQPADYRMTLSELSHLLQYSTGQTHEFHDPKGPGRFRVRAAPSAGGLYPVELYVLPLNVANLDLDLYHYDPYGNGLEKLERNVTREQVRQSFAFVEWVMNSSVLLLLTGKFGRLDFKYGERSYRYLLIEAGAMLEHAMLLAETGDLRGVMLGGYADNLINGMIGCNGVDEGVLICGAVGKEETHV